MGATAHAAEPGFAPGDHLIAIPWQGRDRSAVLHVPSVGRRPMPLAVVLHGGGGTALHAREATRFSEKADQTGFAVVYPNATRPDESRPARFLRNPPMWADGAGRGHTRAAAVDDVGFIGALVDHLCLARLADPRRAYITGFSNGAAMALRAAVERPGRFAAAAAVAGTLWIEPATPPIPATPLLYITGDRDPLNPVEGGEYRSHWGALERKPPLAELLSRWASWFAAPPPRISRDERGIVTWRYRDAGGSDVVVASIIENCGHVWPGGRPVLSERLSGPPYAAFDATAAIWRFFEQRALAPRET